MNLILQMQMPVDGLRSVRPTRSCLDRVGLGAGLSMMRVWGIAFVDMARDRIGGPTNSGERYDCYLHL